MEYEIKIRDVSKSYDDVPVLQDINHVFRTGESYAFVGHNGCGKSTFLRILSGLTAPTKGKVEYSKKFNFAYIPDKFPVVKMTGRNYLRAIGGIEQIPLSDLDRRIETFAKDFFIQDMLEIPLQGLSKGTLQKISVIQAILKETDILLMDEPLSGQDQESQGVFVDKINELRTKGTTIFMSCHEPWLVEALSDQVFSFQNKKLIPYIKIRKHNYILLVEAAIQETAQEVILWDNMKRYGTGYQLRVAEEEVKDTVMKLWESGWKLKGMYDENNKNGKISANTLF